MSNISIEQPPSDSSSTLKDYLVRMFVSINHALKDSSYYPPRNTMPAKFRVGDVFYFSNAIPTTDILGEGLWVYKSTGWTQIA